MRSAGIEFEEIDYARTGLSAATVREIVKAAGGVAKVLNTRHAVAKQLGWATAPPDAATFAEAAAKDVNLLRRPILIDGGQVIVGFDRASYAKLAK